MISGPCHLSKRILFTSGDVFTESDCGADGNSRDHLVRDIRTPDITLPVPRTNSCKDILCHRYCLPTSMVPCFPELKAGRFEAYLKTKRLLPALAGAVSATGELLFSEEQKVSRKLRENCTEKVVRIFPRNCLSMSIL